MASADGKREVLAHRRNLKANIAAALNDVEGGRFQNLKDKLLAIQSGLNGFDDYLSTTIEAIHYNEQRDKDSVAAQKAFDIPELLESIMESLTIADIMRCYQVCRTMRDTIEASSKLQVKLCLMPTPDDTAIFWPSSLQSYDHFSCEGEMLSDGLRSMIRATLKTLRGSTASLPTIGSRWKRMFICQPPIRYMLGDFTGSSGGTILVESDRGVTVGDLLDEAGRVLDEHRSRPLKHTHGEVQRVVRFAGVWGEDLSDDDNGWKYPPRMYSGDDLTEDDSSEDDGSG